MEATNVFRVQRQREHTAAIAEATIWFPVSREAAPCKSQHLGRAIVPVRNEKAEREREGAKDGSTFPEIIVGMGPLARPNCFFPRIAELLAFQKRRKKEEQEEQEEKKKEKKKEREGEKKR